MLNALQKLNIYVDDEEVQEVKVGRMKRKVILMDTLEARQEIMQLFAQRSKDFIKTSVEWAPNTVQSHLQEYINAGKYLLSYFTEYFFVCNGFAIFYYFILHSEIRGNENACWSHVGHRMYSKLFKWIVKGRFCKFVFSAKHKTYWSGNGQ